MNHTVNDQVSPATNMPRMSGLRFAFLLLTLVSLSATAARLFAQDKAKEAFSPLVDAEGNISLPRNFETEFTHLGTIAVATEEGKPIDQMHSTFTRRQDLMAFQKTGSFADGTVLVKEVRGTTHSTLTTGHTSFAKDVKVWFVMIKDSKKRFPDNKLWGDSWGWALFKGDDPEKQVATDYSSDCRHCHVPAEQTDWVFTQCYPLLKRDVRKSK